MSQDQDLASLIGSAEKELVIAQARQDKLHQHKPQQFSWFKIVSSVVLAGCIVYSASDGRSRRYWVGVSEKQQAAEMTAALTAANLAVDRSHAITGEWPDRVPLPALAALVELQNPGPNYRLLVRSNRWLLTMSASGDLQKAQP